MKLARAIALVALPLGVGLPAAAAPAGGTLVVLNKSEATASLIDLDSRKVVATLPTGEAPHEVAVSPDGRYALATNYGTRTAPGSTLTLIDVPGARVVRTIDLGAYRRPHGVAWLRDGKRALVTAEEQKALLTVDVDTGKVAATVVTDQNVSHMVALVPDGSRAFVANIGSGTVTAVDLGSGKVLAHIATGKGAEGIDVTPDGRQVWVTNRAEDTVSVIDAAALETIATLESKSFPIRARVTPDQKHVLVSNARSGDVAVFDAGARKLARRVPLKLAALKTEGRLLDFGDSSVPIGIVVDPAGKRAFVAHANADAISVIDLETWEPKGTLGAGKEPDGMACSPLAVETSARVE
jgi:YVTN family beta-propeller protein